MRYVKIFTGVAVLALSSAPAFAHPGLHTGLAEGFIHPFSGWDHMLAMAALGLWLGGARSLNAFFAIATAITALAAGFTLGTSGFAMPMVEYGILASVLVFGLLAVTCKRLPGVIAAPLIAGFMLLHGHAHGAEATGEVALFGLGFMTASALIITAAYAVMRATMIYRTAYEAR